VVIDGVEALTTFFPNVTLTQCLYAFIVCTAGGLAAGAVIWWLRPCPTPAGQPDTGWQSASVRLNVRADSRDWLWLMINEPYS
jgi:hypothetical protein